MSEIADRAKRMTELENDRLKELLDKETELAKYKFEDTDPLTLKLYTARELSDVYRDGYKSGYLDAINDLKHGFLPDDEKKDVG
jgi:hypothetical protein